MKWFAAALLLSALPAQAGPVDGIITGRVHTGEGQVEAVAWTNDIIVYAGPAAGLAVLETDEQTGRFTTGDGAAFPGLVDAHVHLAGIGERELRLNLDQAASIIDLQNQLAGHGAGNPGTAPLYGRGWIETHWPEARFPTAADLDQVLPDRPVMLERADGHAAVVNTAMLQAAGIDKETPDPAGGEILRDDQGQPTGMLIDKAMGLVDAVLARADGIDPALALRTGAQLYASRGWTAVHNMSVPAAHVPVLERLAETGQLPIRVYNAVDMGDADFVLNGPVPRVGPKGLVVTRTIKVYADGALGSRGAALLQPYADRPDSRGLLFDDGSKYRALYAQARAKGVQIATHAIGDAANRRVLDWYEAELAADTDHRWRVEHAQIINPKDIPRFGQLGVIASMQPSHAIGDLHFAPYRLGIARLAGAYAWASLTNTGAVVAAGSDAPVEVGSPLIEFYALVARRDLSGFANADWHPEEAVDRSLALKMLTQWPAYAAFAEKERGLLKPGMVADISVFSKDLMTVDAPEILTAEARLTVVAGDVVFEAP